MDIDYYQLTAELEPELLPGERLIWTGKPGKGLLLRSSDWFLIPFSFVWFGGVLSSSNFSILRLDQFSVDFFMIPFYLVGIYMSFGRFIIDMVQRANTIYGVTNNRILTRSGLFSKTTSSVPIKSLYEISINENKNKRGTIRFGPSSLNQKVFTSNRYTAEEQIPAFEMIDDVRDVYQLILKNQ
jgi:hypothetical protein